MKNKKSAGIVALVIFFMTTAFFMDSFLVFQNLIYDRFYESEDPVSQEIVIVGIDDLSYEKIGRWPYSRTMQSQIFENILRDKPAALGIDILYDSKTEAQDDQKLIDTLKEQPVVCGSILVGGKEQWGYLSDDSYIAPFGELKEQVSTGYINASLRPEDNGVVRKAVLSKIFDAEWHRSFAGAVYEKSLRHQDPDLADALSFPAKALYIDYAGKPTAFENVSAYLVYEGMIPDGFFEDKIVLFGPYSLGMQDEYLTPVNKDEKMFGVEIHANIIQNIINGSFKEDLPGWVDLMLILLAALLVFFVSRRAKPLAALLINATMVGAFLLMGKLLYSQGMVFQVIYPILTIFVLYIITIIYNYLEQMLERKRITGIFGKYVAPQIVNKILAEGEESLKLGGDRKYIFVLFVDIRGFTPLSEKATPEEVVGILNEYLDLCAKAIFHNGGTLDKFIGDAAMAFYNAPLDLADHALCAVKSAWEMKQGAQLLVKGLEEKYGRAVQFGIGINSGYAVVGNIGSSERMDYTAIGDTVNTAARLESNAKGGQILISEETYNLVKDKILSTALGGLKVKGKEEEIQIYQVDGIKDQAIGE